MQEAAAKSARTMMDGYFGRLRRLSESVDKLDEATRDMLRAVVELRARSWQA